MNPWRFHRRGRLRGLGCLNWFVGAIVEGKFGTAQAKKEALKAAGTMVAKTAPRTSSR